MEEEKIVKEENVVVNNNNNSNNKNAIIAILIVLVIALAGIIIYLTLIKNDDKVVDNNANNQQQQNNSQTNNQTKDNNEENNNQVTDTEQKYENNLTSDENVESGVYGTVYLEGYAKTIEEPLCNGPDICQGDEETVTEVLFYVTKGKVDEIKDWFATDDNGNDYLPLGCLENDLISFIAMADDFYKGDNPNSQEYYSRDIEIGKTDSEKIIGSNENNTITLRVEKKKFKKDVRYGFYMCNSFITGVEVVK